MAPRARAQWRWRCAAFRWARARAWGRSGVAKARAFYHAAAEGDQDFRARWTIAPEERRGPSGPAALLVASACLHRGLDLGRRVGDRAQPHAGCVEHRVGDRRGDDGGGGLARAPRLLVGPVDELDDDLRRLREFEDRIARPVEARHHRAVELQLLDQRAAHGLHHAALDLILQPVRIADLAAVVHDIEPGHADDAAGPVDLDLGDGADIGAHQLIFDI